MDKQKSSKKSRKKFFKITNVEIEGDMLGYYFIKNDEPHSFNKGNFNSYYKYMKKSDDAIFQTTSAEKAFEMFFNRILDNSEPILLERNLRHRTLVEREFYKQFITFDVEEVTVLPQLDGSLRDQNQPSRVIEHDYILVNK